MKTMKFIKLTKRRMQRVDDCMNEGMPHLIEQSPQSTARYICSDLEYLGEEDGEGQVTPHQHHIASMMKSEKTKKQKHWRARLVV